jgi:hypothetical protein
MTGILSMIVIPIKARHTLHHQLKGHHRIVGKIHFLQSPFPKWAKK